MPLAIGAVSFVGLVKKELVVAPCGLDPSQSTKSLAGECSLWGWKQRVQALAKLLLEVLPSTRFHTETPRELGALPWKPAKAKADLGAKDLNGHTACDLARARGDPRPTHRLSIRCWGRAWTWESS